MPKKSFKDNPVLAFISAPQEAEEIPAGEAPRSARREKGTYWRACLNLRAEYKEYVADEAWKRRITATDYINGLIAADMEAKQADMEAKQMENGGQHDG